MRIYLHPLSSSRSGGGQIRRVASGSAPSSRALDTMELVNKVFSRPLLFSFRFDLDVAHTCPICFSSSHRSSSSPRSGCDLQPSRDLKDSHNPPRRILLGGHRGALRPAPPSASRASPFLFLRRLRRAPRPRLP